jgi:hypothetical protein
LPRRGRQLRRRRVGLVRIWGFRPYLPSPQSGDNLRHCPAGIRQRRSLTPRSSLDVSRFRPAQRRVFGHDGSIPKRIGKQLLEVNLQRSDDNLYHLRGPCRRSTRLHTPAWSACSGSVRNTRRCKPILATKLRSWGSPNSRVTRGFTPELG